MRPMIHTDYERYDDPMVVPERPKTSLGTSIALIVIVLALIAAITLLVRAGTDGIDSGPVVSTVVDGPADGTGN